MLFGAPLLLYGCSLALVYEPAGFPVHALSAFERSTLLECPCRTQQRDTSLCLPVWMEDTHQATAQPKKEVFAFSVTSTDQWKHYDWEQVCYYRTSVSVCVGILGETTQLTDVIVGDSSPRSHGMRTKSYYVMHTAKE